MADDDDISEAERRLFEQLMHGTVPLHGRMHRVPGRTQPAVSAKPGVKPAPATGFTVNRAGDVVQGFSNGQSRKRLRQLRHTTPARSVDLHGQRSDEAQKSVERAVRSAQTRGLQTLLIIHGRGLGSGPSGPVLRDVVVSTLTGDRVGDAVLGFCTAPPQHGGAGALMVQLRRPRT